MADRRDDTLAEVWAAAESAKRRQLNKANGGADVNEVLARHGKLRPAQEPPQGDWTIWTILAGRGFGKTRAGAEWVHAQAATPGRRFALVGPDLATARSVMVEGESGLWRGCRRVAMSPSSPV